MGSPKGTVQLSSSNGTVWITEPFWKASDRYQAETGEVLCRMILGAQAFKQHPPSSGERYGPARQSHSPATADDNMDRADEWWCVE